MTTLFITGIDTDVGKSVACGALAKCLIDAGHHVFTQKLVETGCTDSQSVDLATHQTIVGKVFNTASAELHCPYTFTYPASPHLAAEREGKIIDRVYLRQQMKTLQSQCEHLLVEGAGGLCVPLNQDTKIIDFIAENKLPIVLVTSAKLGSINHTLLSLDACQQRGIEVRAVIYNHYGQSEEAILKDSRDVIKSYINKLEGEPVWIELETDNPAIRPTQRQIKTLLSGTH